MLKISVITVCYNSGSTIKDAIESVIAQDYPNIEYIIVDGGSKDDTKSIVDSYSQYISKYISEPDGGIYDAMNKAIKMATGDVIGLLNSDDFYYSSQVVSDIANCFSNKVETDIIYGNISYVNQHNTDKIIRTVKSKPYYNSFFEDGEIVPHPTFFVKRKVYEQLGNYDLSFKFAADYEYTLRALKIHGFKAYYLDQFLVKMRMGGATTQNISNILKVNQEILYAFKKNKLKAGIFFLTKRIYKKLSQFG
jgi:glycosyltransferase involved in cell wall biosynthesis